MRPSPARCWSFDYPPLGHPAARHPPRCRLLGAEAARVDPHGARCRSGHPLESQAAAAPRWPAADLDRRGVGQAHEYRALLRTGRGFLSLVAPARIRLVSSGDAGRVDLRRRLAHRLSHLAGRTPCPHPLTAPRAGPRLGGSGMMKDALVLFSPDYSWKRRLFGTTPGMARTDQPADDNRTVLR